MSYSNLTRYVKLSPNKSVRKNAQYNPDGVVDVITIHHMAGNATVENCGALFANPARQASSNYGIGTDGRIACFVKEEDRSWCTGSRENDYRAITIEVANNSGEPNWTISDAAYKSLLNLCEDICRRYNFRLNFTGDKNGNLTMHKWFQATGCPGPYLESKFPEIAEEVNRRLGGEPPAEPEKEEAKDLNLPILNKGSKGDSVKALQILLIGYGYPCGKYGVDGSFGSATESAVKSYQQYEKLGVDGIVGSATWAKLLGV